MDDQVQSLYETIFSLSRMNFEKTYKTLANSIFLDNVENCKILFKSLLTAVAFNSLQIDTYIDLLVWIIKNHKKFQTVVTVDNFCSFLKQFTFFNEGAYFKCIGVPYGYVIKKLIQNHIIELSSFLSEFLSNYYDMFSGPNCAFSQSIIMWLIPEIIALRPFLCKIPNTNATTISQFMYKELFENLTLIKNFQGFFTKEEMQQAKADPAAIWFFNTQKLEDYIDVRGTEDEFYCVLKNDNVATLQSQFYKTNFNGIAAVGVYENNFPIFEKKGEINNMQVAAYFGSRSCFKFMQLNGGHVDGTLRYWMMSGDPEMIKNVANIDNHDWKTCTEVCCLFHQNDLLKWILETHESDIKNVNPVGFTLSCCLSNNLYAFKKLLKYGFETHQRHTRIFNSHKFSQFINNLDQNIVVNMIQEKKQSKAKHTQQQSHSYSSQIDPNASVPYVIGSLIGQFIGMFLEKKFS